MEISQARISSGVGVRPTPYGGDCASATPPASKTTERTLSNRIVNASIARDPPRLNGIVVAWHVERVIVLRHVEELGDLRSRRLNLTDFVCAPRKDLGFGAVPIPVVGEFGVRHAIGRSPNLGGFPVLASVSGYFHLANGAPTGPSQAPYLVESAAGQLLSSRRIGD